MLKDGAFVAALRLRDVDSDEQVLSSFITM